MAGSRFVRSLAQTVALEAGLYGLERMGVDARAVMVAAPVVWLGLDLGRDLLKTRQRPDLKTLDRKYGAAAGGLVARGLLGHLPPAAEDEAAAASSPAASSPPR